MSESRGGESRAVESIDGESRGGESRSYSSYRTYETESFSKSSRFI